MTARQFKLTDSPLQPGITLIEASAGTGKTYTIAGIVLRLILEKELLVENILVTTYTELATAELRTRIRELIRDTLLGLEIGHSASDLVNWMVRQHGGDEQARLRLQLALQSLDQLPVYTIHGFCHRILKDRAFETGAVFDAELVTDQTCLLREVVDDFWRSHFYSGNPLITAFLLKNGPDRDRLLGDLIEVVNKPTMRIEPEASLSPAEFCNLWESLCLCWKEEAGTIREVFANPTWAKGALRDAKTIAAQLSELDQCLSRSRNTAESLECFGRFSSSEIGKNTRKGHTAPKLRFFDLCQELRVAEQQLAIRFRADFLAWARPELKRRKWDRNVLFFDDLLSRLRDALEGGGGAKLATEIRSQFPAALVDEFQDTDPVQYQIFRKIYLQSKCHLFLIGDPKQAIYGFRGADVFTYITAAQESSHQWTLGKNWRSETALVRAVNRVFDVPNAFVLDGIALQPAEAATAMDAHRLQFGGHKEPPFQLWLLADEKLVGVTKARNRVAQHVAGEIARLLNVGPTIDGHPLEPRQIAVLVASNEEARLVQEALDKRSVPSVLYGTASVFSSNEAAELRQIFAAVIQPTREKLVRAALATETLGLTREEFLSLKEAERDWEQCLLRFQEYHELWRDKGFMPMLRKLFLREHTRTRLLHLPDGERRLTNLLHLAEILHRKCAESDLGMAGLVKTLADEIAGSEKPQAEEHELRLERDEKAVRVITIHKSKGLQFEIAFCPFSWNSRPLRPQEGVTFHRDGDLILDLSGAEESNEMATRERLADNVRRLYVALTRARHRCYLVWGNLRTGKESAAAHLLGPWSGERVKSMAQENEFATTRLPETAAIQSYRPAATTSLPLAARTAIREIDRSYGISSFTRLIAETAAEPESPEQDSVEAVELEESKPAEEELPLSGMFGFPRGAGPGICLHQILQEVDFAHPNAGMAIIRDKLAAFGVAGFDKIVCEMITKVSSIPVALENAKVLFSAIESHSRLSEVEFHFSIQRVNRDRLIKVFPDDRLHFQPISGFIKGFIDLVFQQGGKFYVVDWKSNWLGARVEDYSQEAMAAEMQRKFYYLQLSIYVLALHRFLAARLQNYDYDRHLGGVAYVFLRGLDPRRPEYGVYRARPEADFIRQLDAVFDRS